MLLIPILTLALNEAGTQFGEPATASSISDLAEQARSFVAKDQFDSAPALPTVVARRFDVLIEPAEARASSGCFGSPIWSYDAEQRRLWIGAEGHKMSTNTLVPTTGAIPKPIGDDLVEYFTIDCLREELEGYTGTNAYGAEVRVAKGRQRITAIADTIVRNAAWKPSYSLEISGEAARALVKHVRVRFTGTLQDWKAGLPIACGTRRQHPRYRSPVDRRLEICLVSARIERVQIVDARNGHVLYESVRRP